MRRFITSALIILSVLAALSLLTIVAARTNVVAMLFPTATPTSTPTTTPTPQSTLTPTLTPTATPTNTPTTTPTPQSTLTPTPLKLSVKVELSANKVRQGHTFFVKLTSSRAVTTTATFEDRTIPLYLNAGAYWGALGLSRLATLGPRTLTVNARDANGTLANERLSLEVVATQFETFSIDALPTAFDPSEFVKERNFLAPIIAAVTPRQLWSGLFIRPANTSTTSEFGELRIWKDGSRDSHEGTDFEGKVGDPVIAANDGVVVLAQPLVVRGNIVMIDHGLGVHTGYYHLSEILVKKNEPVKKGQLIGKVGGTGHVTGPHLHWNFWVNSIDVDPLEWTTKAFSTN